MLLLLHMINPLLKQSDDMRIVHIVVNLFANAPGFDKSHLAESTHVMGYSWFGYADQFGGPKGKKFKYSQLKEVFLKIWELPTGEQYTILEKTFSEWKGKLDQIDDVLVIGVRF